MTNKQTVNLRNILLLSALTVFAMVALSAYGWIQIPAGESVCVHWNAAGVCDRMGGKFEGLFLMPIIVAIVSGVLAFIPRVGPRAENIMQSAKAYVAIWRVMLLFFLVLHIGLIAQVLGYGINIATLVPFLIGVLFVVIGNYMGKVRSNYFVGIRTPWTLSSELSWNKTHRLGGKLLMLMGILFMLVPLLSPGGWWIYLLVGSVLGIVAVLMAYSYFIWKNDQDIHAH